MSSFKIARSPTPLHLPGGTATTTAVKVEIRGRLSGGDVVSGLAETLSLDNNDNSKALLVSFNGGNDWAEVPANSTRIFEFQCRDFWLKADTGTVAWTGLAGIRARY